MFYEKIVINKRALIGDSIPLVVFFSGMIQHVEITYSEEDPYKRLSYSGQQLNGMNNGKGLLTWKNGAAYEGEWQLDVRAGFGIYTYSKDSPIQKYQGCWMSGKKNGLGRTR